MQAVRLTQTMAGRGDLSPVYAPNGLSIAFSSDRAGNEDVYIFSLTAKTVTALTNNPARDFEPAFAPDGTAVVYVSTRKGATESSPRTYRAHARPSSGRPDDLRRPDQIAPQLGCNSNASRTAWCASGDSPP